MAQEPRSTYVINGYTQSVLAVIRGLLPEYEDIEELTSSLGCEQHERDMALLEMRLHKSAFETILRTTRTIHPQQLTIFARYVTSVNVWQSRNLTLTAAVGMNDPVSCAFRAVLILLMVTENDSALALAEAKINAAFNTGSK